MTVFNDLNIELSSLCLTGTDAARIDVNTLDLPSIGVALQRIFEHYMQGKLDYAALNLVSITHDITGSPILGEPITFQTQIERQTRTLVFASGIAQQGEQPVLKATMIYRLG